jgi:hypothetical protein
MYFGVIALLLSWRRLQKASRPADLPTRFDNITARAAADRFAAAMAG